MMDTRDSAAVRLSTADVPQRERCGWLRDVIDRQYVKVDLRPPADGSLFNEMTIHSWQGLRLSSIRSNAIGIDRLPAEPYRADQDAYFAVVLLSGHYALEQQGRRAVLEPGDITLYDATRPHRIRCPRSFSKLIISIPRAMLRDRIAGAEHCTALRIPGSGGIGAVASRFLRTCADETGRFQRDEFLALAEPALDLLALAVRSVRPSEVTLCRSRSLSLHRVKCYIEQHLSESNLNAAAVAGGVGLSSRYINELFKDDDTSLMRHVWRRRLENCGRDLTDPTSHGISLSEIAFRWGFNDLAHFSRAFKRHFGCPPREYRRSGSGVPSRIPPA